MENDSLEISAKTVEEAIELATLELGAARDEVAVDVVSHGRSGILGIGAEPARVRVRRITGGGVAGAALTVVSELLGRLGAQARASIRSTGSGPEDPAMIDVQGEDAGLLIGKRGDTLRSLQYIVNTMLSQREREGAEVTPVVIDVEHYRRRREQNLRRLAEQMAQRASGSGRPVQLEPMTPADRRIVHMALADSTSVTTESTGEGADRRVTIKPIGDRPASPGPGRTGPRRRGPARQD